MNLYCADLARDPAVQRLLCACVAGLLRDRAVQEVRGNYAIDTDACHVFADFGVGRMRVTGIAIPSPAC
jgi:hypothetical protein